MPSRFILTNSLLVRCLLVWPILFVSRISPAFCQERIVLRDSIYSQVLQENRALEVLLPNSYRAGSKERYDVVYVLDGEWTRYLLPSSYDFATGAGFVPENIFVRILNRYNQGINLRDRDFTPTRVAGAPVSGGADRFLTFLKKELFPYINQKYPSTGASSLVGGSLAGMFTIYALLKEPSLFKSYIAVEPSLWWDNGYVNRLASQTFGHFPAIDTTTLWIAGRQGSPYQNMGIAALDSLLQRKAPSNLLWKTAAYANETHWSAQYKGYYDGFKFSYAGYVKDIEVRPTRGILLHNEPFEVMVIQEDDSTSLRYTTDGTLPTTASREVHYFIPLAGDAELQIKSFSNRSEHNKLTGGSFSQGELLAGNTKLKERSATRLHYAYYQGTWDDLPTFDRLVPTTAGLVKEGFSLAQECPNNSCAYVIEGQLVIPAEGYYVFYTQAAQQVKLSLAGRLIIDGSHPDEQGNHSFVLPLKKGGYSFRLELLSQDKSNNLHFSVYQQRKHSKDEWWTNTFLSF